MQYRTIEALCLRVICTLLLAILVPQPASAFSVWPFGYKGIDYTIRFNGADPEMTAWFAGLALDKPTETDPPQNREDLEQEANTLAAKVKKALAAKGYLEAQADPKLAEADGKPVVTIAVDQQARYTLSEIRYEWEQDILPVPEELTFKSRAEAPIDMQAAEADAVALAEAIGKDACLLSLVVTPKLRLNAANRTGELVFVISHGPRAHYGAVSISGNTTVSDEVIHRAVSWKPGGCYEAKKLDDTRTTLIQNQLFSSVTVEPVTPPDTNGLVTIRIEVKERVARTVRTGLNYSTDLGFGLTGSWEHRNLFGDAEKLTSTLTLAEREQSIGSTLRIPAFMHDNQVLALSSAITYEDRTLYTATTFEGSAMLERKLSRRMNGGAGVGFTLSSTEDAAGVTNQYALLTFPAFLEYDGRDNSLDARKGIYARIGATPYTETIGDGGQFLKLLATTQGYVSNDTMTYTPTLAGRVSVGSIQGAKDKSVPADIRFYAGGGGSVRGYTYQSLAPYENGIAQGGASLVEASGELRMRFTPEVGGVLFLDAGHAYADAVPDFTQNLYYGAGVGARYYSPIGPLRADVAFPLNGSSIGQTGYQFYVSLGQAF